MSGHRELFNDLIRFETELWDSVDRRLRADCELPLSWYESMSVIERHGSCRVNDIAEALSITIGGTSKLVDRIERAGLCVRRANADDRRSSLISLTGVGERRLATAHAAFDAELARWFDLADTTLDRLHSTLRRLRANAPTQHEIREADHG